jgi:hypothetical protein
MPSSPHPLARLKIKNPPSSTKEKEQLHSISPKAMRTQTEPQLVGNVASKIEPKQKPIKPPC